MASGRGVWMGRVQEENKCYYRESLRGIKEKLPKSDRV
jgi:hypothetical protein